MRLDGDGRQSPTGLQALTFIRDVRRKLRFKRARFEMVVMAFSYQRMQHLTLHEVDDQDEKRRWREVHQKDNQLLKESFESGLFTSLGKSLSLWAALEQCLVITTAGLLFTSEKKAGIVMYSIINFGALLGIIGKLFADDELFVHLKPRWDKLGSRLRALKDMRDRVAHHSVFSVETPVAIARFTGLKPSPFDGRSKSRKQQPLTRAQVEDFIEAIRSTRVTCGDRPLPRLVVSRRATLSHKGRGACTVLLALDSVCCVSLSLPPPPAPSTLQPPPPAPQFAHLSLQAPPRHPPRQISTECAAGNWCPRLRS